MRKPSRTPSQKKSLVRAWRASGRTEADFAADHGIPRGQLRSWAWQLGKSKDPPSTRALRFVELHPTVPRATSRLELRFTDGRVLSFDDAIRPADLAGILAVLKS